MVRRNTAATRTGHLRRVAAGLIAAAVLMAPMAWPADYSVIVNASVPGSSLSKDDLKAIFLGDKTTWSNGKPIKLVVLEEGAAHKAFLQDVLGKTPAQFDNYWKKLVFAGKAAAPRSFGEAQQLIDYVSKEAGAIGYAGPGTAGQSIRTLKVE